MKEKHFTIRQINSECPNIGVLVNLHDTSTAIPIFIEKLMSALAKHFDVEKGEIALPEISHIFDTPYYYKTIVIDIPEMGLVEIEIEETWLY